jgi:hypothetical protein
MKEYIENYINCRIQTSCNNIYIRFVMGPRCDAFLNARCVLHERMYFFLHRVFHDAVDICDCLTLKEE